MDTKLLDTTKLFRSRNGKRISVIFVLAVSVSVLFGVVGGTVTDSVTEVQSELDLREANVVGVEFDNTGGSSYRFDVTLYHDDDGEDGYANWWQVETLDGENLGRRKLLHAHGTREFTRSETIDIPDGIKYVVVRGHDQTHGYGGQVMIVNIETGKKEKVKQGSEKQNFSDWGGESGDSSESDEGDGSDGSDNGSSSSESDGGQSDSSDGSSSSNSASSEDGSDGSDSNSASSGDGSESSKGDDKGTSEGQSNGENKDGGSLNGFGLYLGILGAILAVFFISRGE